VESEPLAIPRNRLGGGPVLALGAALLFACGVAAFALLRAPARPQSTAPASRVDAAPPPSTANPPLPAPGDQAAPIVVRPDPAATPRAPAPAGAAPAADSSAPQRAWLEVVVLPFGQISVDGKAAGSSRVTLELSPGEHAIEARTGGSTLKRRVVLAPGERRRIVLR
jgi:hypothetical protein